MVVGDYHGCALTNRHRVQCWEPGDPTVDFGQADPPDALFSALAADGMQTCGLTLDGDLLCWGADDGAEYDYGQTVNAPGPFAQVSTGEVETCAIGIEHEVQCWGADPYPGATVTRPELPAVQVSLNGVGCLLTEDQHVTCWGNDEDGQLDSPSGAFSSIASGQRHACGLDADGKASCWGENGLYTIVPPTDISFTRLAAGDEATCGLMTDGGLRCWGATRDWDWYLYIAGFEPEGIYTDIALGRDLAWAVRDDGGVLCWGGPFGISSDYPPVDDPLFADE